MTLEMRGEVSYLGASSKWRRQGDVEVHSILDTSIASFPLEFLECNGDNTWSYIRFVISLLVDEDPSHHGAIHTESGVPVGLSDAPVAGVYTFIEAGELLRSE
jgi:hypothetical protein